jgi:hypothetical protein
MEENNIVWDGKWDSRKYRKQTNSLVEKYFNLGIFPWSFLIFKFCRPLPISYFLKGFSMDGICNKRWFSWKELRTQSLHGWMTDTFIILHNKKSCCWVNTQWHHWDLMSAPSFLSSQPQEVLHIHLLAPWWKH